MALESIIAQRIAAAASARARLEASNFSLEPIREGLAVARGDQATAAALALRRDAMAQQGAEFEASQAGLPEPLARTLAPNILPPGADQGALDAVVSALGARGGANLLAKLAAYTAIWERDKAAAARNTLAADRLARGAAPKPVPPGVEDARDKEGRKREWLAKYGPLLQRDPSEWPPEMLATAPPDLADNLLSAIGIGGRFKTRFAFDKAKWDATLSNMNADNARADALAKAGKDREARLARVSALAAVKGQIRAFEDEHGLRQKIETQNPDGSFSTIYRVDPSGLTDPDAKAAYRALLEQRDRLAGLVGEAVTQAAGGIATNAALNSSDMDSRFVTMDQFNAPTPAVLPGGGPGAITPQPAGALAGFKPYIFTDPEFVAKPLPGSIAGADPGFVAKPVAGSISGNDPGFIGSHQTYIIRPRPGETVEQAKEREKNAATELSVRIRNGDVEIHRMADGSILYSETPKNPTVEQVGTGRIATLAAKVRAGTATDAEVEEYLRLKGR